MLVKSRTRFNHRGVNHLESFLLCLAGWVNRNLQHVIEYLQEEVRVLRELTKRPRFNDDQRRRLAAKAKPVGLRRG
jgi:hypothetical protein